MLQRQPAPHDAVAPPTGNTERTRPENRLYFPALDGLRTLAVSMVFLQHYFQMPWGYTGVDLFFVLSGFLITGILYDTRDRPDRLRSFYIRRTLRIFPLYYAVFALLLLLTPLLHLQWNRVWLVWPLYLGNIIRFVHPYSHNPAYLLPANGFLVFGTNSDHVFYLGHLWSLCLEEQFYLLWPWLVFTAYTWRRLVWICTGTIILLPFLRVLDVALLPAQFTRLELNYSFTPLRLDSLLLGGLLALLLRSSYRDVTLAMARRLFLVACILILPALIRSLHSNWFLYRYPAAGLTWGESLIDIAFTSLIAVALIPGTLVYRLFSLRPLRWAGRISYGVYIFHDLPHNLYYSTALRFGHHSTFASRFPGLTTAALAIPCTLLLASLSFRFLETPFLNLKERWAPSHTQRSLAPLLHHSLTPDV